MENSKKKFISVLTPAYNRAYKLPELYGSLLQQSEDFSWVIIDDGSTDNTEFIVQSFIKENKIDIVYVKKRNGGKHTAINEGIKLCNSELTIIVDSDDRLLPNGLSDIRKYYLKYQNCSNVGCWTFLRCGKNGDIRITVDKDEFLDNYIRYRIKGNRPGDMAEVFLTEVLKKNPFPEFPGERFLSEDVVWIEIGKKYDSVYINKPIYECEYLEDGLTSNDKIVKFKSPYGSMLRGKQLMYFKCGMVQNIKGAIIYDCYRREIVDGKLPEELVLTKYQELLTFLLKPLGKVYNRKWKKYD